ncbi:hypothetical protein [Roseofilum capinflatum]|uniref:Uncharacterized protein n=1 Tax=Roseofilum capinflatum BLCC-M114 TaxID=3022440 RepID=A0ABT7B9B0_9CYAN|nr:hypothetical protein [Roseofilum capinflatum]MDJ1175756.1 hypothetical protein [Roseofilum capinflatum BLCC-M114]
MSESEQHGSRLSDRLLPSSGLQFPFFSYCTSLLLPSFAGFEITKQDYLTHEILKISED